MSEKIELYKQHTQKQENYTYYLIALSVAAIGYATHQTHGIGFTWSMIPLGFAILCWAGSVTFGLRYLKTVIAIIFKNMQQFIVSEGNDELAGSHPIKMNIGNKVLKELIDKDVKTASMLYLWQGRLFYGGMIFYFIWHLYWMYLVTGCG
jgi:hypothetical protein